MNANNKTNLIRWCIWFFIGNVFLFWLIGLNYLPTIPWLDSAYLGPHNRLVLKVFVVCTYLGQLGLLAMLPCLLIVPLIYVFPKRNSIFLVTILIATVMAIFLAIDTATYKLYRFHLNGILLNLALNGMSEELFGFSNLEYAIIFIVASVLLLIEYFYAAWLWRYLSRCKRTRHYFLWIISIMGVSLYLSYGMLVYSAGYIVSRIYIDVVHCFPFYTDVLGTLLPSHAIRSFIERRAESYLVQPKKINAPLQYPLKPLYCAPAKRPQNLVIIVIDAWRFDMLNSVVSPNLAKFAKNSWVFSQHFSGGDATGPGIFSLFYGMPATYWTAMESQQRGPVLIDEMLKQHYQFGIFSSAGLHAPAFDYTVFQAIQPLQTKPQPGKTPYERDKIVTKKFIDFINKISSSKQPFFSFLFYDAVHSYCTYDDNLKPFTPAVKHCNRMQLTNDSDPLPYLNRYKNSVLLVDQQIKQVLDTLEAKKLLNNTVVLITGDHGEEFNDNHLNYWGHASNFTRFQVQTPLIVHWPGRKTRTFMYRTSHFDIAPTLMKDLLGCQVDSNLYSLGVPLLETLRRPYLIIGSYITFGIVEPDQITYISPTGNFSIEQLNGQTRPGARLNMPVMHQVFQDLLKFYKS